MHMNTVPSAGLAIYMQLYVYMYEYLNPLYICAFLKDSIFCNDCNQSQIDATNACHPSRNIMHADQCHHKMIF